MRERKRCTNPHNDTMDRDWHCWHDNAEDAVVCCHCGLRVTFIQPTPDPQPARLGGDAQGVR